MANSLLKYDEVNSSLPYINLQRPYSAANGFDDVRRVTSFDVNDRSALRHEPQYLRHESPYPRQSFAEKTQMLGDLRVRRKDTTRDRLLTQSQGSLAPHYVFDTSSKQTKPTYGNMRSECLSSQIEQKNERIRKLQNSVDALKEAEIQQLTTIQHLKQQLMFYEAGPVKEILNSPSIVVTNLQQELSESHQQILELESRLRTHMEERERAEQERASIERNFQDTMTALTAILLCDVSAISLDGNEIIAKVDEVLQENSFMKGKQISYMELIGSLESEKKNNRETILRLASEAEKNESNASKSCIDVDNIRVERDAALLRQEELMSELETMKTRLEASHRAWSQMKKELEDVRLGVSLSEAEKHRRLVADSLEGERSSRFREDLALLLADGVSKLEPYEEQILFQVNKLNATLVDKTNSESLLEKKLSVMADEFEKQCGAAKSERHRQKQLQDRVNELEEELRRRNAKDLVNEISKEKPVRLLQKIGASLKMSPFTDGVPSDVMTDEIICCIEDLIDKFTTRRITVDSNDAEAKRVHILNLQRKVKSFREQLSVKDGQIEEMNDKMKEIEEKLTCLETRDDEDCVKNKKLSKILEKYKLELNEAHLEMRQLQSRLIDAADLKSESVGKDEIMTKLRTRLRHVEQENVKLQKQLSELHHEDVQVLQIKNELKFTKSALDEVTRQHKQLFDLRQLLARMLGISCLTSVSMDFEMISRMEKLIVANYRNPEAIEGLQIDPNSSLEEFKKGYLSKVNQCPRDCGSRLGGRVRLRSGQVRSRARSLSPRKRVDSRVY